MGRVHSAARSAWYGGLARLPDEAYRRLEFTRAHRRPPHLSPPRTFSEKVTWRLLHDRRPQLLWTCDKIAMKEHAAAHGVGSAALLWSGTDVGELEAADLPERWVLKPNHRSGLYHFGEGRPDVAALRAATAGWLDDDQVSVRREWAYSGARPLLLVEEHLDGADDLELKLFAFRGESPLVLVVRGRRGQACHAFYTTDWRHLPVVHFGYPDAGPQPRPELLEETVEATRALGAEWDFMRLDFFVSDGGVRLSEYTPYPNGGIVRWRPPWADRWLGDHWTLPAGGP